MNMITFDGNSNGPVTMSSREIAALCEKEHKHIIRDIEKMLTDIFEDGPDLGHQGITKAYDARGYVFEYHLPKDLTVTLITGYRVDLRYKVIKRLEELEGEKSSGGLVVGLDKEVRSAIGGIVKSIIHKELTQLLPEMVEREVASSGVRVRRGHTALKIWDSFQLPPKMRGATNWLGNRLVEMGCCIGRADNGNGTVRVFDPDLAEACMKNGLQHKARVYASERIGQGRFKLIGGTK